MSTVTISKKEYEELKRAKELVELHAHLEASLADADAGRILRVK